MHKLVAYAERGDRRPAEPHCRLSHFKCHCVDNTYRHSQQAAGSLQALGTFLQWKLRIHPPQIVPRRQTALPTAMLLLDYQNVLIESLLKDRFSPEYAV